jgi:hypothetical protein
MHMSAMTCGNWCVGLEAETFVCLDCLARFVCVQEACFVSIVTMYVRCAMHVLAVMLQPGQFGSYYCPSSEWLLCCCPACIVCMGAFCAAAVTAAVVSSSEHGAAHSGIYAAALAYERVVLRLFCWLWGHQLRLLAMA